MGECVPARAKTMPCRAALRPQLRPPTRPHRQQAYMFYCVPSRLRMARDVEAGGARVQLQVVRNSDLDSATGARNADRLRRIEELDAALNALEGGAPGVLRATVERDVVWPRSDGSPEYNVTLVVLPMPRRSTDLFDVVASSGALPEDVARGCMRQVCEAVRDLHAANIGHRNVACEDLLVTDAGGVLLGELSEVTTTCRLRDPLTGETIRHREFVGRPGYMAPEIVAVSGDGYAAAPADVWSVGCVAFILLAGFPAMQRAQASDWWFNALTRRRDVFWRAHERTATFSQPAKAFIERCLSVDPAARPTAEELLDDPWLAGVPAPGELVEQLQVRLDNAAAAAAARADGHGDDAHDGGGGGGGDGGDGGAAADGGASDAGAGGAAAP